MRERTWYILYLSAVTTVFSSNTTCKDFIRDILTSRVDIPQRVVDLCLFKIRKKRMFPRCRSQVNTMWKGRPSSGGKEALPFASGNMIPP